MALEMLSLAFSVLPFALWRSPRPRWAWPRTTSGADFTGDLNRLVEMLFRLSGRTGNEFDEGPEVLDHERETLGSSTLDDLKVQLTVE